MAAQENTEISTKFSTLNVNAVEFVPSFSYNNVVAAAEEAVAIVAAEEAGLSQMRNVIVLSIGAGTVFQNKENQKCLK